MNISPFKNILTTKLSDFISTHDDSNELEIRFGSFKNDRFIPGINKMAFAEILKLSDDKTRTFIIDTKYNKFDGLQDDNRDNIFKRTIYSGKDVDKILDNIAKNLKDMNKTDFLKHSTDLTENIKSSDFVFMSKNSNKINDKENHLRLTIAKENKHNLSDLVERYSNEFGDNSENGYDIFAKQITMINMERIKFRYSYHLHNFWRIDLSIILEKEYINEYDPKIRIIYEIEIEFDSAVYHKSVKKNNITILVQNLKNILHELTIIKNCNSELTIEEELSKLISNKPHALSREAFKYLQKSHYSVTDKADGVRKLLYIDNSGNIFLLNYSDINKEPILVCSIPNINMKNTVLDGEYLPDISLFLSFDLIFSKNTDYRYNNLLQRHRQMRKVIKNIKDELPDDFDVQSKKFYYKNIFTMSSKIWNNKKSLFKYNLDGLIFTPITAGYNSTLNIYKWKDEISVDVRTIYIYQHNFTAFHAFGAKRSRYNNVWKQHYGPDLYKNQIQIKRNNNIYQDYLDLGLVNNAGFLGLKGKVRNLKNMEDIAEFAYDRYNKKWIFLRLRNEKRGPNHYHTIMDSLKVISENITIEDISRLTYTTSRYNLICQQSIKNIDVIGLEYDNVSQYSTRSIRKTNWRSFHNYIKKSLIIESSYKLRNPRKYLLDIGSGKGGDIDKWIYAGYTDILAIDPSCKELYGSKYSEGFEGFVDRLLKKGFTKTNNSYKLVSNGTEINITVIWGDATLKLENGDAGYTKDDKQNLISFFKEKKREKWDGFDTVTFMFTFHYMLANMKKKKYDKERFEILMNNVTSFINKEHGIVLGVYLNANNIDENINAKNCFVETDYKNDKYYGIFLEKRSKKMTTSDIKTYDNFWKTKPRIMKIKQSIWGWNNHISEPMIYKENLDLLFNNSNLYSLKKDLSFEQYYKDYMNVSNNKLEKSYKNISYMNNIFYYKIVPKTGTIYVVK